MLSSAFRFGSRGADLVVRIPICHPNISYRAVPFRNKHVSRKPNFSACFVGTNLAPPLLAQFPNRLEKEYFDMPENGSINEGTSGANRTAGTTGTTGTTGATGSTGSSMGSTGSTGTGTAAALSQTAKDYGQKVTEVATQAKDYVSDKLSVAGDKIKELQNADLGELAENAKEYARQKPGQALLISAAVGMLLGLIIRGRR
jgi:ElaB/YqjD/DUF883 family membrane-anchored ribosome-binding protein